MKVLLVADREERVLWDHWSEQTAERFSDVSLILSAGDLKAEYLEFLVTVLNVPLVYVRGNHDGSYDERPPEGCINADGSVVDVECIERAGSAMEKRTVRIAGAGGSMRYKSGAADMYTEREMGSRIRRIDRRLSALSLLGRLARGDRSDDASRADGPAGPALDIFLTHAPCRGYGDLDDLPHTGFECFNGFLNKYSPQLHVYGHVHKEYGGALAAGDEGCARKGFCREIAHPSGTTLINACGYHILELK